MTRERIDIIGQTFGGLKVLSTKSVRNHKTKVCHIQAECECVKCHNGYSISKSNLIKKPPKSCGCIKKRAVKVGDVFDGLIVTGLTKEKHKKYRYRYFAICNCTYCGKIGHVINRYNLLVKGRHSCGCMEHSCKTAYKEIIGSIWSSIKCGAKKRKLDFTITIKEAWDLYESQNRLCSLTKIPIVFTKDSKTTTASLDRIDSSKGYVTGNIQWVYRDINFMKQAFSMDKFIYYCHLISENYSKPDIKI